MLRDWLASRRKLVAEVESAREETRVLRYDNKLLEHYRRLGQRSHDDSLFYQAQLFHAWKALRAQGIGMQRMARKIKKLRTQIGVPP